MKKKIFLLTTIICILTTINVYPYKQNIKKTIVQTNQYLTSAKDAGFESEELYRCVLDTLGKDRTSATDEELSKITEVICRNQKIASTKGIEKLTSLRYLNLYQNNVSTMDLSKNTNLVMLNMTFNKLTNIDLSKNTNLQQLYLNGNQITNIDLTNNSKLIDLNVYNNKLTSINISNLTELKLLLLSLNKITTIDLSKNTKLEHVYLSGNGLTSLTLPTSATNLTRLDLNANKLSSIDISKLTNLNYFIISANKIANLDTSKNTKLEYLYSSGNQLTNVNLSNNTALKALDLYANNISSIDLSKLTNLTYLNISSNKLSNLNLSGLSNLTEIYASSNNLSSLNLGNQSKLEKINAVLNNFDLYNITDKSKITYMGLENDWLNNTDLSAYPNLKNLDIAYYKVVPVYGSSISVNEFMTNVPDNISLKKYTLYKGNGLINESNYKNVCTYNVEYTVDGSTPTKETTTITNCEVSNPYEQDTITGENNYARIQLYSDDLTLNNVSSNIQPKLYAYYDLHFINLTSDKYPINESDNTIEVNGNSDQEILNNVKVSWDGANVTINGDKLQITYDNKIIKEFSLKRLTNPVTGSLSLYIIITIAIVTTALIILSKRNTKNNSI